MVRRSSAGPLTAYHGYLPIAWHMRGLIYSRFLEQLLSGEPSREKKLQRHKETQKK